MLDAYGNTAPTQTGMAQQLMAGAPNGGAQMSGQSLGATLSGMVTPYNSGQFKQPAPQGSSFMSALGTLGMPNIGGGLGGMPAGGGAQMPQTGGAPTQTGLAQQLIASARTPLPGEEAGRNMTPEQQAYWDAVAQAQAQRFYSRQQPMAGAQMPQTGGPAQNIQQILAGLGVPQPGGFQPGAERQHNLGQLAARYGMPMGQFSPHPMPQAPAPFRLPPHVAQTLPSRFPSAPRPGVGFPATSAPGPKPMDVGMTPSPRYLGNQPAMLGGLR